LFKIYLPPVVLDYVTFSEPNTLSLEAFDAYQGYFFQYELTLNDKTNILTRPFNLTNFLNCTEKLVIQYQDIFHTFAPNIISGIDLFLSNLV
jgi:hypothetical protein